MMLARLLTWEPGPTGQPEGPTFDELLGLLWREDGLVGLSLEDGRNAGDLQTICAVMRGENHLPIGIAAIKLYQGNPELVDICVHEDHRGQGRAWQLVQFLKAYGFDLRLMPAIYDGPLTGDGVAFRDEAVDRARDIYGEAR